MYAYRSSFGHLGDYGATPSQLAQWASVEVSTARTGAPVQNVADAGQAPAVMMHPPGNMVEARYLVAFWLARGSRVLDGRGNTTGSWKLYGMAESALRAAQVSNVSAYTPGGAIIGAGTGGEAQIQGALREAATTARSYKLNEIASTLDAMGREVPGAVETDEGVGLRQYLPSAPDTGSILQPFYDWLAAWEKWRKRLTIGGATLLGVVALALGIWGVARMVRKRRGR